MMSKPRSLCGGFTIVETIIVLAVTSALVLSALLVFRGRVPRTQFETTVNELSSRLSDMVNEISSGYYPANNIRCDVVGGVPTISEDLAGTEERGEIGACIYLGQNVQFGLQKADCSVSALGSGCDTIKIYTIFGSRKTTGGKVVNSIAESNPRISEGFANNTVQLGYGAYVNKVVSGTNNFSGISIVQNFGSSLGVGSDITGGTTALSLVGINGGLGRTSADYSSGNPSSGVTNPQDGYTICLNSAGSEQKAIINFGRGGSPYSIDRQIFTNSSDLVWSGICG